MITRLYRLGLTLMAVILIAVPASGQGAPEPIQDALDDLNERLGTSLTLSDFNWRWSQDSYDNGALGCPEAVDAFTPDPVVGYQFIFEVGDETYDYRVSADRTVVILCSVTNINDVEAEVTETPEPLIGEDTEDPYSNPLCPEPAGDLTYMPTRLSPEIRGYVTPGLPVRLRQQPNTNATVLGDVQGETEFFVISGPECDSEGFLWWNVEAGERTGWIAEGRDGEYFIEPLPAAALATSYPAPTVDNATTIAEVARLQGNFGDRVAISPDNTTLTIPGGLGAEGVMLYDLTDLPAGVRSIPAADRLTDVHFAQQPNLALFGGASGGVRLWNIAPDASLIERAFLFGHDQAVTTLFNPAGSIIASVGGLARLGPEEDINQNAIILWDVETVAQIGGLRSHTDSVTALAFNDAGTVLYSVGADGLLITWDLVALNPISSTDFALNTAINALANQPGTPFVALGNINGTIILSQGAAADGRVETDIPVTALAFNADGTLLFSGHENGTVNVWQVDNTTSTLTLLTSLVGHTEAVQDLTVSADGTLIASLGTDNLVILWAVGSNSFG